MYPHPEFTCLSSEPFGSIEQLDVMEGEFLIHYTMEGRDKPEGGVDEEGVPRMAHRVWMLEEGAFFGQRGYRTANPDDGLGGSTAIDVRQRDRCQRVRQYD